MKENNSRDNAARLLLLLSRVEFTEEEKLRISRACDSFTGWRLFTGLAVRHGVAALVWQNLCDLALDGHLPGPERTLLEGLRHKSIARVAYITNAAAEAVNSLEKEGIRVVLLKGLALEHTVYGSRGLRQMSDADLLVAPSDALRARDILIAAGFESMPMKSRLYRHIILDLGNHLPEMHRGGISVDLHYRLFGPEGEEMVSRAITEAEEIAVEGNAFRILPPVAGFLGLVSHIQKHEVKGELQLRLYADIYLMLRKHRSRILNPGLMEEAERAGILQEVREVLTIMEQAWGLEIPEEMKCDSAHLQGEKEAGATVRALRFMHALMYPGQIDAETQREMFTRNLHSIKGPGKKLVFIIGDLFPSVEFMKRRYGCRSYLSVLLRYPHRLGKLIWIFGPERGKKRNK